jgi:tetrahydromethanopterin S-methyltransferase subunit B
MQHLNVALIQDGARGHYGLATALRRAGLLGSVYTDFYCPPGSLHARIADGVGLAAPALGKRMRERYAPHLDGTTIRQSLALMATLTAGSRFVHPRSEYYKWASSQVGKWVRRTGLGNSDAVIGFVRNIDPDLCRYCRDQGLKVVGDQMIAPAATEMEEMRLQHARWPGWQPGGAENDDYFRVVDDVERRTWANVDHVICPSHYVKDELRRHGVSEDRVSVVHYAVGEAFAPQDRSGPRDEITIGFMGSVGIRKGIQYFTEAAKRLARPGRVRFVAVGPVELSDLGARAASEHVTLVGKVPRSETLDWFRRFDIFYFPSTCEGSAYVLMEAMATGLPIVTSPNSGTVARHGQEAFISAYDAIDEQVASLEKLIADRDLRLSMGASAARSYKSFDLDAYAGRLRDVVTDVMGSR